METISYKCSNCGGGLVFDPNTQKFKCEFCNSEFIQREVNHTKPSPEQSWQQSTSQTATDAAGEMTAYNCPSCGGEIVTDATTAATFCHYCHSPVVMSGKMSGEFRPDYILPFTIDRQRAVEILTKWVKKKRYVPKGFFSSSQIEKMTGVYYPYLLYNCKVDTKLNAEGTNVRRWINCDTEYTETKVYSIRRGGNMEVEHITRNALQKDEHQLADSVMPFDMTKAQPFSSGFLSGFVAENRNMKPQDFEAEIEQEVKKFALDKLRGQVSGYGSIAVKSAQANIRSHEWKYALMPVWTITYNDKKDNKHYYFAINGQTGSTCGELPVDNKGLRTLFLCIFLPIMIVFIIGGLLI